MIELTRGPAMVRALLFEGCLPVFLPLAPEIARASTHAPRAASARLAEYHCVARPDPVLRFVANQSIRTGAFRVDITKPCASRQSRVGDWTAHNGSRRKHHCSRIRVRDLCDRQREARPLTARPCRQYP